MPIPRLPPVAGRRAIVTGAGNGLGRAIALSLVDRGAVVLAVGRRPDALAETRDLASDPERLHPVPLDVSDEAAVAASGLGVADLSASILVNNAGIPGPVASIVDITVEEWDEVFDINVRGAFLMCRAVLPDMLSRGFGQIVNIASVTGKRPLVRRTPYAASKLALIGLTRTLAAEVGPRGVIVNSVSPGPVRGPRMDRNFRLEAEATGSTPQDAEREFVRRSALNRLVEESEVASAVVSVLEMPGLCAADIDLSAGMIAP